MKLRSATDLTAFFLALICAAVQSVSAPAAADPVVKISLAEAVGSNASPTVTTSSETDGTNSFSAQYTDVTKKVLLSGIALERLSLTYRLEAAKQPKLRLLRYFAAQEAAAAGGLAFEATGANQFRKGRDRPLKINNSALRGALATTMTTSIIAGSSSALELTSNLVRTYKKSSKWLRQRCGNKICR